MIHSSWSLVLLFHILVITQWLNLSQQEEEGELQPTRVKDFNHSSSLIFIFHRMRNGGYPGYNEANFHIMRTGGYPLVLWWIQSQLDALTSNRIGSEWLHPMYTYAWNLNWLNSHALLNRLCVMWRPSLPRDKNLVVWLMEACVEQFKPHAVCYYLM